jgi:hypothetical protein
VLASITMYHYHRLNHARWASGEILLWHNAGMEAKFAMSASSSLIF